MHEIEVDTRLRLLEIDKSHAKDIFTIINNHRDYFKKWLAFVDDIHSLKDEEKYIENINHNRHNIDGEIIYSIIYQSRIVGVIGLKKTDWPNRIGEIGYWIDPMYEGKGIITNSCRAVINHGFEKEGANRIEIKCGAGNNKSSHIPEHLEFTYEGTERDGELVNGKFIDIKVYSLLKREWFQMEKYGMKLNFLTGQN
jgi:ribosomal-protein-serine acetyltransferase